MLSLATWMIWAHTGDDGILDLAIDRRLTITVVVPPRDGNGDGLMGQFRCWRGAYRHKLAAKDNPAWTIRPSTTRRTGFHRLAR
jgi:hypothetical protein